MSDGKKVLLLAGSALVLVFAVVWFATSTAYDASGKACLRRWSQSGMQARWDQGQCLVQVGARWVPEDAIKVPAEATQ